MKQEINTLLEKFGSKRGKIDLSLDRMLAFLEKIGSPHLRLPPVIHVAGTNGKGSTIAFLKAIIEADGQSCHVYTSPHLVRFNERVVLNGQEIPDELLHKILVQLDKDYNQHNIKLTFFELTTIVALIAFASHSADYLLLETGMGGRYDATNLIAKPVLTIITPISLDHIEFLGDTLEKIAFEKAGIIKTDVTCISSVQLPQVQKVLQEVAAEKKSKLIFSKTSIALPRLALKGEHQKINAATAVTAAEALGFSLSAIEQGLTGAKWPARMQQLTHGPLLDLLPDNFQLWLDGAHNLAGAEILRDEISLMKMPVYLVIGMMNKKDATGYFNTLNGKVEAVYTIPIPSEADSYTPKELKSIAEECGIKAYAAANAAEAIKEITMHEKRATGIFICGSLYLAGHILKDNK